MPSSLNQAMFTELLKTYPITSQDEVALAAWALRSKTIEELLDFLNTIPLLAHCYEKSAGVGEGYNIREHSEMVMRIAQQYKAQFHDIPLPWNEFLLFLALHDIGKGVAKEAFDQKMQGNKFLSKSVELEITRLLVEAIMQKCNVPLKNILIFKALLERDLIGDYLLENTPAEQTQKELILLADKAGVKEQFLFKIFTVFHMCDAASYAFVRAGFFHEQKGQLLYCQDYAQKIIILTKSLSDIQKGRKEYKKLLKANKDGQLIREVEKKFFVNLPELQTFLHREHSRLLSMEPSEKSRQYFSSLKKGFREILLTVFKIDQDIRMKASYLPQNFEIKITNYAENLNFQLGNRRNNINTLPVLFPVLPVKERLGLQEQFNMFSLELQKFRRNFHIRYSPAKILPGVRSKAIKNNSQLDPRQNYHTIFPHLQNVFLHGTNSNILINLPLSNFFLLPTGVLTRLGIAPLSGELGIGSTVGGVNRFWLSGVDMDRYAEAITYSESFKLEPVTLRENVANFVSDIQQKIQDNKGEITHQTQVYEYWQLRLFKIEFEILKLKTLQQTTQCYPEEELKKLFFAVDHVCKTLLQAFGEFKKTKQYQSLLSNNGHVKDFIAFEASLIAIQKAIVQPLHITDEMVTVTESFPIIFASRSVACKIDPQRNFEMFSIPLQLGDHIKDVYVKDSDIEKMQSWLVRYGLENQVDVHDVKILDKATLLHKEASPYLADIASIKKLKYLHAKGQQLIEPLSLPPVNENRYIARLKKSKKMLLVSSTLGGTIFLLSSLLNYPLLKSGGAFISYVVGFLAALISLSVKNEVVSWLTRSVKAAKPSYTKDSWAYASYEYGRKAQRSWLVYFSSCVDPRAYNLKPYYLGRHDERKKIDSNKRFRRLDGQETTHLNKGCSSVRLK